MLEGIRKLAGSLLREAVGLEWGKLSPSDELRKRLIFNDRLSYGHDGRTADFISAPLSEKKEMIRHFRREYEPGARGWKLVVKDPNKMKRIPGMARYAKLGKTLGFVNLKETGLIPPAPGLPVVGDYSALLYPDLRNKGLGSKMYGEVFRRHPAVFSSESLTPHSRGTWLHFMKPGKKALGVEVMDQPKNVYTAVKGTGPQNYMGSRLGHQFVARAGKKALVVKPLVSERDMQSMISNVKSTGTAFNRLSWLSPNINSPVFRRVSRIARRIAGFKI